MTSHNVGILEGSCNHLFSHSERSTPLVMNLWDHLKLQKEKL